MGQVGDVGGHIEPACGEGMELSVHPACPRAVRNPLADGVSGGQVCVNLHALSSSCYRCAAFLYRPRTEFPCVSGGDPDRLSRTSDSAPSYSPPEPAEFSGQIELYLKRNLGPIQAKALGK